MWLVLRLYQTENWYHLKKTKKIQPSNKGKFASWNDSGKPLNVATPIYAFQKGNIPDSVGGECAKGLSVINQTELNR